jgi:cystathionine beta-lyase/cystathionine gamma-synthase
LSKFQKITQIINDLHLNNEYTFGNNEFGVPPGSPLTPSINFSSAYAFNSIEALEEYHKNSNDFVRYARDTNGVARQCEEYLSATLSNQTCFVFNSGMSAIDASLAVLLPKRENVITFGVFYRKTQILIERYSKLYKIKHIHFETAEEMLSSVTSDLMNKSTVLIENFSNPFLTVLDIEPLKKQYPECIVLLDFSMQGLLNSNQHRFADISVTSATKYIGGHNDFLAGAAFTSSNSLAEEIWSHRSSTGGILDPMSSLLMLRSFRTYDMRLENQVRNAQKILDNLSKNKLVKRIFYPFEYENADQSSIKSKFNHGGAVMSFEVIKNVNLEKNISKLRSIKMAPSFGSVDTLVEIPAYMSKRNDSDKPVKGLSSLIKSNRFMRLSIGCEPFEYLEYDLEILLS